MKFSYFFSCELLCLNESKTNGSITDYPEVRVASKIKQIVDNSQDIEITVITEKFRALIN